VMLFVFYQFNPTPLNFNPNAQNAAIQTQEYAALQQELDDNQKRKAEASIAFVQASTEAESEQHRHALARYNEIDRELRAKGSELINGLEQKIESNDKDYVFIHFVIHNLPKGLIGLLLAVILSAAMSSTASELNALASTTVMDLYRRNHKEKRDEKHYVNASKWFTFMWGLIAIGVACTANLFDNLIQLVNIIGSIFYGNVLGIFLMAFFIKYVQSRSVFIAAIITQVIVIIGWWYDWMPYLWLNLFGCALVILLAVSLQLIMKDGDPVLREPQ